MKYNDWDKKKKIAVYGIGTETERFINENSGEYSIIGLLDGFKTDGQIYGYPIISINDAIEQKIELIIVVARPGSCKAIAKRIRQECLEHGISLFDIRGKNLLDSSLASYDFENLKAETKNELIKKITEAECISFDLFDTLVMRKVPSYTDIFEIMEKKLEAMNRRIPGFSQLRLCTEKECSRDCSPTLIEIYEYILKKIDSSGFSAAELAEMEWTIDFDLLIPRTAMCKIFQESCRSGKPVVITTDTYYSKGQICKILDKFDLAGYSDIFVSSENRVFKSSGLFDIMIDKTNINRTGILHIGDDMFSDIESASLCGMNVFRIFSGWELFEYLGGLGTDSLINGISDKVKLGLVISRLLNDPFIFEKEKRRLGMNNAEDVGYLICASVITDFVIWVKNQLMNNSISQMLFCARDGYLIDRLFSMLDSKMNTKYFLTSRTAAVRAGMESIEDIEYVDSMHFFGSEEESLYVRFGIKSSEINGIEDRKKIILDKSEILRSNYKKYINSLDLQDSRIGFFDFVAKGTTQLFINKLLHQELCGFYFLQLEPEFMKDKGLNITSFYSEQERENSNIFENYYFLETVLTSPNPSVEEFDVEGNPVYSQETRSSENIKCVEKIQKGIEKFFDDYLEMVNESEQKINKQLDEIFLGLINKIKIHDSEVMSLIVEDPFFGRMTPISDIIG